MTTVEKHRVIETVQDFFTFGPRNEVTIYPPRSSTSVSRASASTSRGLTAEDNSLKVHFGTWASADQREALRHLRLSKNEHLTLNAELIRRRDNLFRHRDLLRYVRLDALRRADAQRRRPTSAISGARARSRPPPVFAASTSSKALAATSPPSRPRSRGASFRSPTATSAAISAAISGWRSRSTRAARGRAPGSGLRVEAHEETMFDPRRIGASSIAAGSNRGGSIGGALDLNGYQRPRPHRPDRVRGSDPGRGAVHRPRLPRRRRRDARLHPQSHDRSELRRGDAPVHVAGLCSSMACSPRRWATSGASTSTTSRSRTRASRPASSVPLERRSRLGLRAARRRRGRILSPKVWEITSLPFPLEGHHGLWEFGPPRPPARPLRAGACAHSDPRRCSARRSFAIRTSTRSRSTGTRTRKEAPCAEPV